jgi:hypothetical protein
VSDISDIQIKDINIPGIQTRIVNYPLLTSPEVPISVPIGFPIIEMPCVEVRKAEYENEALLTNDPEQNVIYCDGGGGIPTFTPINYTPEELVLTEEAQPQRYEEPETPASDEPPPPTAPKSTDCPPPDAEPIGTKVADGKGTKEITSYQLIGNRCVTQYSEVSFPQQIVDAIPSVPQVVTTGTIAVVATAAAASTPFLLRIVKPLVKQVVTRVKKLLGQKTEVLSKRERMIRQREMTRAVRELRKMKK